MTSLRKFRGSGLGYSLLLVALSVGKVAVAQSSTTGDKGPSPSSSDTSAAPSEADKATAPVTSAAAPAATAPAVAKAPAAATTPMPAEPTDKAPAAAPAVPIAVENLPASGYFPNRNRGLVGGSLWLTMHGLQFPYMAPPTSKNEVRVAISGSVWDDTSYAKFTSNSPSYKTVDRWLNQGRAVLRVTPAYTTKDGWFVQGQTELVAFGNQFVGANGTANNIGNVDDLFVRAGLWDKFDVTVGRFQGWEVYHYGMGLDLNTFERLGAQNPSALINPPKIYGLDFYWDRPDGGAGNYAAHYYATDYLRFELLGQIGAAGGSNMRGVRPVAILDLGYLKVKAGWEYGVTKDQTEGPQDHSRQNGFGGAVQFIIDPYIEGGINGAIGYIDTWDSDGSANTSKSSTTSTYGGFLNGRVYGPLMLGIGANQTHFNNLTANESPLSPQLHGQTDWESHFQSFAAVQYSFWNKLFLKFVGSYSQFHYEDIIEVPARGTFTNKEYGGRLRMMYLF